MAKRKDAERELSGRQKWLLALLGEKVGSRTARMDPIRIMKALFVFAQETPKKWLGKNARYDFQPYSYGPCSFEVYEDLDQLESMGLLRQEVAAGRSWGYYSVSSNGKKAYKAIKSRLNADALAYLAEVKKAVLELSFNQLLRAIYRRYPKFATRSVFRG